MNTLLRFEARIAFAALRRIVTHPSRRALWYGTGALAAAAIGFDVATSDVATRDLGTWTPSPLPVAAVAAGILAFAALVGSRTPLTYGTRPADAIWWRYAGVETPGGQRATTALLTVRATTYVAAGAVPVAALLATAAPQRAGTLIVLAVVMIVLAAATVLIASACAPRTASDVPRNASRTRASSVVEPAPAPRTSRTTIPPGFAAARWLIAARRGEMLVPYDRVVLGVVAGYVAPRFAGLAGGQAVALAIVVGGLAVVFDAAIRGTTAPATLRSPWWRAAVGTSPLALTVWALCDATSSASVLIGVAIGLGLALGDPGPALVAIPGIVLAPVALRLTVLAVDTVFPAAVDRRGAGAVIRIVVVGALTAAAVTLALFAGARGGAFASIATTTLALIAIVVVASQWCSARLAAAYG